MITLDLTEAKVFEVLGNVLLAILPDGVEVVQAQVNRVPEVKADDFVIMTPLRRPRLSTNEDEYEDCYFVGSMEDDELTVTEVKIGVLASPHMIFGANVLDKTDIGEQVSGTPGGIGVYKISKPQTIASQNFAAGVGRLTQHTEFTFQLDVHGPNSGDNAQRISTVLRDEYGVQLFDPEVTGITPLYADDPRQGPYTNDQQQVENRWMIETNLQINPTVIVPQQFAGAVEIDLVNVDAEFPIQ